jgi:hypothetical protein
MRISLFKILLTCLLFAVTGVYGNITRPGCFNPSTEKATAAYSHSTLDADSELELSVTHTVSSSTQQVSIKKLNSFGAVENTEAFASRQSHLFSFPKATSENRSVHLLLIFPFHYFW